VRWAVNIGVLIGLIAAHLIVTLVVVVLSLRDFSVDIDTPPLPKTTMDRTIGVLIEIMGFPVVTGASMLARATGYRFFYSEAFVILNSVVCGIVIFLVCRWLFRRVKSGTHPELSK
jgi:hypothetical protein